MLDFAEDLRCLALPCICTSFWLGWILLNIFRIPCLMIFLVGVGFRVSSNCQVWAHPESFVDQNEFQKKHLNAIDVRPGSNRHLLPGFLRGLAGAFSIFLLGYTSTCLIENDREQYRCKQTCLIQRLILLQCLIQRLIKRLRQGTPPLVLLPVTLPMEIAESEPPSTNSWDPCCNWDGRRKVKRGIENSLSNLLNSS